MKIIKYFIEAFFIYSFFIIIKIIGLKNSRFLFSFIFNKIGPLVKSKKIINQNIDTALKRCSNKRKKEIISNMWSNYGMTFVEYLYLNKFKNTDSHINIKGKEILNKIIKNKKPVIFVSGHFANFELMSMELTKAGIDLATIYRPLNNFFLNPFMEYLRKNYVCKNQIKKGITGIRHSLDYLKKNYCIALMIDQRVSEGIQLPFFKKKALTTTLPAQLALKFNCNIVPVYISRKKNKYFEMKIFNPIKISKKNKTDVSLNLNKVLERMIMLDPSQWIWTHNRWK